jgi:uncharacterized DUF497 family protein
VRFEWNSRKAQANLKEHGVSFEDASTVVADPHARLRFDYAHSEIEDRFLLIGFSDKAQLLVVCHCYPSEEVVRIISARKGHVEKRIFDQGERYA